MKAFGKNENSPWAQLPECILISVMTQVAAVQLYMCGVNMCMCVNVFCVCMSWWSGRLFMNSSNHWIRTRTGATVSKPILK